MDSNKKQQQQSHFSKTGNSSKSCLSENRKLSDSQSTKPWPRSSRRREQPSANRGTNNNERNSKQYPSAKVRPNVDKRPRARGGVGGAAAGFVGDALNSNVYSDSTNDVFTSGAGLAAYTNPLASDDKYDDFEFELNSVYAPGSKKQNLNHLLNFHYAPRESEHSLFGRGSQGAHHRGSNRGGVGGFVKKQRYNKEQFLQANFQFVIKSSAKPKFTSSPDTLIDWQHIEQINIQTTEEPQCPICLYPPIAAKLTRCGHAYCWPCILHYLALSDKTWRKCPICYEAIHTADLKSTTIVQQQSFAAGQEITLQLMRRKKASMYIEQFRGASAGETTNEHYPFVNSNDETILFTKFLIAKKLDILNIIEREGRELIAGEDSSCPEFVFIQQALDLLKDRREKLGNIEVKEDEIYITTNEQLEEGAGDAFEKALVVASANDGQKVQLGSEHYVGGGDDDAAAVSPTINPTKYYYFYQSLDGQNIYLHPLNVKMLQACYGSLENAPSVITACIMQREQHSMDEDHRRKFTCLGHLPLTCQFSVVEVDLQPPIVTGDVLRVFRDDLLHRKKERQRRDRDERKREKQINEINDRQMGKLIATTAHINLESTNEFPMCGFEETLPNVGAASNSTQQRSSTTSYSKVAVVGECSTSRQEYWPTLASPSISQNSFQELSSWRAAAYPNRRISERSSECESLNNDIAVASALPLDVDIEFLPPQRTKLCDVLEQAMSKKKQNKSSNSTATEFGSSKKNKKNKKMIPLFTTGMNFNGN